MFVATSSKITQDDRKCIYSGYNVDDFEQF